jgi:flagellin-like protein
MGVFSCIYANLQMLTDAGFVTTDRSQVGIGTLIVFIAMVLVAAIGAGVLLNTAGLLQSNSQQTSQQAQAGVTDRFQITGVVGNVVNKTCAGTGEITLEGTGEEDSCIRVESGEPLLVNEPENDVSGPAPGLIFGDVSTGEIDRFETISLSVSRPADPDQWPSLSLYKGGAARENEEVIAYDIGLPTGIDAEDTRPTI